MKLIREELTNTDFLVEDDKNGKKNYFIEGSSCSLTSKTEMHSEISA